MLTHQSFPRIRRLRLAPIPVISFAPSPCRSDNPPLPLAAQVAGSRLPTQDDHSEEFERTCQIVTMRDLKDERLIRGTKPEPYPHPFHNHLRRFLSTLQFCVAQFIGQPDEPTT